MEVIPSLDATSCRPQEVPEAEEDFTTALTAIMTTEEADDVAGDMEFVGMGQLKADQIAAVMWERVQKV